MSPALLLGLTQALTLAAGIAFLCHAGLVLLPHLRRGRSATGDADALEWHFLIPCRDREPALGDTIGYLRATFPAAHVWVITDPGDDTAAVVTRLRGPRHGGDRHLHLARGARTGGGAALDTAHRELKSWMGAHADTDRTVVVVLDADSRPAANSLDVCAAHHLFGDPAVGAVRVDVRVVDRRTPPAVDSTLRHRFGSALARVQDLESRGPVAAHLRSLDRTGTPGLPGQFIRMTALDSTADGPGPWRGTTSEDSELGTRLAGKGWKTAFTADTHVEQEALPDLRHLLAKRTRSNQEALRHIRHLRRIRNSDLGPLTTAKLVRHLIRPWTSPLAGLVRPIPYLLLLGHVVGNPAGTWTWLTEGAWVAFAVYGASGLLPFAVWGPIHRHHHEPGTGFPRSLAHGLAYAVYARTVDLTSWRAAIRLARSHSGAPGTRTAKRPNLAAVALEH
ncbi:glycosyltransferase [Actinokineospora spheciospongiae]|uniref:glycosyltransferase n=1 Tax=Actinokineospora spheciospongiae TaxID=909613 RepID=UPI000D85B3E4|nr:glycosyltransferase [Actinokineospora spheciospongiae]PWW56280.1 cellulose synthase/poly-beta-1,6-N-acetylglucosamine synthase-like glycosyltransferase [Actinokineospora spheciospongiae]